MGNLSFLLFLLISSGFSSASYASDPDWREGTPVLSPRSNPYSLSEADFLAARLSGLRMTLEYPVEVSGILMPWRPVKNFIEKPQIDPLHLLLQTIFKTVSHIKTTDELFQKIGLNPYPSLPQEFPFDIPAHSNSSYSVRMGVTLFKKNQTEVFTLSCAACHTSNLFGKQILGLSNRFPRANEFFVLGKKGTGIVRPLLFQSSLDTTDEEAELYRRTRDRIRSVGAISPQVLGLDTSLAQVALSLAHRNTDEDATFSDRYQRRPREEPLTRFVADSKPAVWWNVKYKNRWLSDGSVVSGNPIFTNFLWNEIGRGTDLQELREWLTQNSQKVSDLTTAVFSNEAPRYTDFFPPESISLSAAKRGEQLFVAHCERCHGSYEKAWNSGNARDLNPVELLKTTEVLYPRKTPVMNVGTDPQRAEGMKSLERVLNPLRISRESGVVIRSQSGYVPPPLVGIWARWPYFHNNSAPSLCSVLTIAPLRPTRYYAGEALNPKTDFDSECNGYPLNEKTPASWKSSDYLFDTNRPGLSNKGHDDGILSKNGVPILSADQRDDLIQFLKTL
jgi:mono/diheme cytochrome c family protein